MPDNLPRLSPEVLERLREIERNREAYYALTLAAILEGMLWGAAAGLLAGAAAYVIVHS